MKKHYQLGIAQGKQAAEDFWTDYYPEFPGQDVESLIDQYQSDLIFAEAGDLTIPGPARRAWIQGFKEAIMKSRTKRNPRKSPGITQKEAKGIFEGLVDRYKTTEPISHSRELSRDRARKGGAIGRATVFTPILVTKRGGTGERKIMRLSPVDANRITRGPGPKGIVTDQKTGKQYAVWGRDCGLPGCFCDAEVISMGTSKPAKKSRGKKPARRVSKPTKVKIGKPVSKRAKKFAPLTASEIQKTIKKANKIRTRIIEANKTTKSIGVSWGVPPVLNPKSTVSILLAWLYAFLGPYKFPASEAAKSLHRSSPAARPKVWKWISVVLQPQKSSFSAKKPSEPRKKVLKNRGIKHVVKGVMLSTSIDKEGQITVDSPDSVLVCEYCGRQLKPGMKIYTRITRKGHRFFSHSTCATQRDYGKRGFAVRISE